MTEVRCNSVYDYVRDSWGPPLCLRRKTWLIRLKSHVLLSWTISSPPSLAFINSMPFVIFLLSVFVSSDSMSFVLTCFHTISHCAGESHPGWYVELLLIHLKMALASSEFYKERESLPSLPYPPVAVLRGKGSQWCDSQLPQPPLCMRAASCTYIWNWICRAGKSPGSGSEC